MAWSPSKEVGVARNAAEQLGDVPICVVVWITADYEQLGVASYGHTKNTCSTAKRLGGFLYDVAMEWVEQNNI